MNNSSDITSSILLLPPDSDVLRDPGPPNYYMVDPQAERLAGTNSRSTNHDAQLFSISGNGGILPHQEISPPSGLPGRLARASFHASSLNNLGQFDPPSPIPLSNSMRLAFQPNPNDSNFPGSVGYQDRRIRNDTSPSIMSRRSNYSSSVTDSTDLDSLSIAPEKKALNISVQDFYDSIMYGDKSNHNKNINKFDSHIPNPHLSNSSLNIPVTPDMVKNVAKGNANFINQGPPVLPEKVTFKR